MSCRLCKERRLLHIERLYPILMQAMNGDMIGPEQEQSYSADMSLLVVPMQFESASNRNVVMLQHRYRDIKGKLPVQVKECSFSDVGEAQRP